MSIIHTLTSAEQMPAWIFETKNTGYALGFDQQGRLQHVYWGARLPFTADYGDANEVSRTLNFDRYTREEFPVWGDYKFNDPCLKVRFSDGVRALILNYEEAHVDENQNESVAVLTIALQDPHYPLRVKLTYKVYADFDLIERSALLENLGDQAIEVEQIRSASWQFPRRDSYQLTTLNGKWSGEFQIQKTDLPMGKQTV